MTTPPTPAPATSSLDAVLGKIDALLAGPVLGTASMTAPQFQEHVAAELEKGIADAMSGKAEVAKLRLAHLKEQVAAAKAIYDSGATLATIAMFQDSWQTKPGEGAAKTADVPQPAISPTGESNVQFKEDVLFVTTEKGRAPSPLLKALCLVAKASEKPALALKNGGVAKADGATIIAKVGEAKGLLVHIAAMFGIETDSPADVMEYEFKWDVADTISALQSAAKLEDVMAQMSGMMAAMPGAAAKSATPPVIPPVAPSGDGAWPLDMATAVLDEKTGLMKAVTEEERALFWGRDSERTPTT